MTTVCFLPPGPSACRGTRDGGRGLQCRPAGCRGLGARGRASSSGFPAASTSPPLQPAPSAGWSWVPRFGPSSCLQPVLPSLGAHCGPTSHCHHCCCHCCCHHHPQESLGQEKLLGYCALDSLCPLRSSPNSQIHPPPASQGTLFSNSKHDPSLACSHPRPWPLLAALAGTYFF